jgi:uroporphyrinogen decarboxylase
MPMIARDVIKTILNKQIPERMGHYEEFWTETVHGSWLEQGYPADAGELQYFNLDLAHCGGWIDSVPFPGRDELIEETDEWRLTKDGRGASLKHWKGKSGCPEHIAFDVTTPEKWKAYREPLLEFDRKRLGDVDAQRRWIGEARAEGRFAIYSNVFVIELLRYTIGDENFLPAMLLEPEWIHDFCQVYLDLFISHYEILFREAGLPDGIYINEDFGYNHGLFCSPKAMAEMIMPYEKKLVSFFKDYGLPVILHSCGGIVEAIPQIIDAGFDCLQPMEVKAGCDLLEIFDTYGTKLSYMGNIDVRALSTNDPEKIREEVLQKLKGVKERRIPYIFHSDHSIPPNVDFASYKYAVELLKDNWLY